MELKIKKLARFTMPLLVAATLVACGSDNTTTPLPEGDSPEMNYLRKDASYDGWGLHAWNTPDCDGLADDAVTAWDTPLSFDSVAANGAIYKIPMKEGGTCFNFIMHKGDEKEPGGDRQWDMSVLGDTVYIVQGKADISATPLALSVYEGQKGALIDSTTVAWDTGSADSFEVHYLAEGGFEVDDATGQETSTSEMLVLTSKDMPAGTAKRYDNYKAFGFELPDGMDEATLISGQLVLVAKNAEGKVIDATGIQLAPALDAVYATGDTGAQNEMLGAVVTGDSTVFRLWAPTAKSVSLSLYNDDLSVSGAPVAMTRKANGTWETADVAGVVGKYYRYTVEVYHATLDKVETLEVTDPYSLSLSVNSKYSQVVDLENQAKPSGWDDQSVTAISEPEKLVIYETHLRDLTSAPGDGGTDALDGKYLAIEETERASVKQLASLAENGMNLIHLMNLFDIATVDEAESVALTDTVGDLCAINTAAAVCTGDQSQVLQDLLESYDPATGAAQALMNDLRMYDTFNWGYDPFHYTTPEGSYAVDAKGTARIEEYRTLIMKLHAMGYRVVMDVVYNHTNSAGIDDKSVLDKIVPGYYQRLNASGYIETSTCCSNTATENIMMGKLMTDSLVTWAKEYKIDGFRFDLMGHQPKQLMVDSLAAVKAVDDDTYFYGEGWNFGEVADNALFVQATQQNMGGTEIGTFSDRLRDAVRGGGPFDGGNDLRANQGFATAGVWNELQTDAAASTLKLRKDADIIRLGMAGNLANFVLLDQAGDTKRGQDVDYNGQKAGYTLDPQENISYVSKHDNQTLWDNNMYKVDASVNSAQRAQMQILALSTNMLGQGVPFFHMGSELLRSKSMQRDSYDSGDWFNTVNYDMSSNNWNVGLPREDKDGTNWPLIATIIADPEAAPTIADIEWTDTRFKELLKIRTSSPLFSLATAAEVEARVDFQNTGTDSVAGVIVMSIDDGTSAGADLDPAVDAIVTVINATSEEQVIPVTGATGFALHADLAEGTATFAAGKFTVPALTTAVFIQAQGDAQGAGLPVDNSTKDLTSIPPFGDEIPYLRGITTWDPVDAMTFTSSGNYTASMTLDAGNYEFKVAGDEWSKFEYGANQLTLAAPLSANANGNINLTLDVNSVVSFTFNANDKAAATLTVTAEEVAGCTVLADSAEVGPLGETNIALIGNVSSWNYDASLQFSYKGANTYQVLVADTALKGADGFKMRGDADWTTQFNVTMADVAVANVQANVEYDLSGAVNLADINLANNNTTLDTSAGSYIYTVTFNDGADLSAEAVQGTFSMCEVAAQ
jgi:pullulanase